jgi:tetratricopeptide (TPR) repeat protein
MDIELLLTVADYETAIEQDPTETANYWRLGLALLLAGETDAAQITWLSVLAAGEAEQVDRWQNELIHLLQTAAVALLARQNFTATVQICEQILALREDCGKTHHLLAQALAQQGEYDRAIETWQQATQQQPDLLVAYVQQAEVQQKLGEYEAAIASYSRALQLDPHPELHLELGRCYLQQGQIKAAIAQFQQAAPLRPDWAELYGEWGYALMQQGEVAAAIEQWQRAMQLCPSAAVTALLSRKIASKQAANPGDRSIASPHTEQEQTADRSDLTDNSPSTIEPLLAAPTGFHETTEAWASRHQQFYAAIEPETLVKLQPPRSIDPSIHFSFRFGEAIALPGAFVTAIPDGRFWISDDETSCACITPDHQFLADLSPEFPILSPNHPDAHPRHHSLLKRSQLTGSKQIEGTVAVLASLQNNLYFHWMFEVLPRWELLRRSSIDLEAIDWFLVHNQLPFQQETLEKLAVPQHKILSGDRHIQADRLIAAFPGSIAWMSGWSCDFLRATFLPSSVAEQGDRLYISRSQTANRRVLNEAEIVDLLQKFGFQSVTLEALSVSEQAALFARAKVVVAPHGSGLTNLVFCAPDTIAIELFSPHYVYPCYWFVSNLVHLNYYYLVGEMPLGASVQQLIYPDARIEDMFIDASKLLRLMQSAGVI